MSAASLSTPRNDAASEELGRGTIDPLLSEREVLKAIGNASKSTLRRMILRGEFPRPVKVSLNRKAWRRSDVARWIEGLPHA